MDFSLSEERKMLQETLTAVVSFVIPSNTLFLASLPKLRFLTIRFDMIKLYCICYLKVFTTFGPFKKSTFLA